MRRTILRLSTVITITTVLTACATSPGDVRSHKPTASIPIAKSPMEAAHCIASLMDERMRYGLFNRGFNNHIRKSKGGVSIVSMAEMGITVWVVDLKDVNGSSVATFYVGDQMHFYTEAIEKDGIKILQECANS